MKWIRRFFNLIKKAFFMTGFEFIPRDEKTGKIDTTRVTQAYVLKTSDGTKISIVIKIDGEWSSIPYDPNLDAELAYALEESHSEIFVEEWARLISEYGPAIEFMDNKVKQANPHVKSKKSLG